MRITDAVLSFPALLVAIALVAIVGPSLGMVIVVIAAVLWTATARIVYSTSLVVIRETEFVLAATAIGVRPADPRPPRLAPPHPAHHRLRDAGDRLGRSCSRRRCRSSASASRRPRRRGAA